jgi:hypothetical protein
LQQFKGFYWINDIYEATNESNDVNGLATSNHHQLTAILDILEQPSDMELER